MALPRTAGHITHVARVVTEAVETGDLVGAEVLLCHRGAIIQTVCAGWADREAAIVLQEGYGFRIASMSKSIVSVAALALFDRNLLGLDDPIARWLPSFAPSLPDGRRPTITVRHLLTHTAGLSYGFTEPSDSLFHRLGISDGLDSTSVTLAQNVALVAQLPLLFEPGSAWRYSIATDVLGAVLEAVTGQTLDRVVGELVTGPLGMTATGFHASVDALMAIPYAAAEGDKPRRMTDPCTLPFEGCEIRYAPSRCFNRTLWPSAGTGMVGSAADYLRFLEMLRCGGAPALSPEAARLFATNAIKDLPTAAGPGHGWGLGCSVVTDAVRAGLPGNPGSWGWGGVYGTHFFVDPLAALSVVCMTNTATTGMAGRFPNALRQAVYRDICDL